MGIESLSEAIQTLTLESTLANMGAKLEARQYIDGFEKRMIEVFQVVSYNENLAMERRERGYE
jgi:hypothetical protein